MCEKAIQRPLKNERQNVSVFNVNSLQSNTVRVKAVHGHFPPSAFATSREVLGR